MNDITDLYSYMLLKYDTMDALHKHWYNSPDGTLNIDERTVLARHLIMSVQTLDRVKRTHLDNRNPMK